MNSMNLHNVATIRVSQIDSCGSTKWRSFTFTDVKDVEMKINAFVPDDNEQKVIIE